jgi:hypothetical protein
MDVAPMNGRPSPRTVDTRRIDNQPIASFNFKYRTRGKQYLQRSTLSDIFIAALQSEMIIPRSPSPVDLGETAVEDLTPEQMREMIRRQRVRRNSYEILH